MNRQEAIDVLYEIGQVFVKEMNLTEIETGEIDCGFWDMGSPKLSEMLKEKYGEMKSFTFHNGVVIKSQYSERWEYSVECGFRFGNPKLSVHGRDANGWQTLGSIEVSDTAYDENKNLIHTGDYKFSEGMCWQPEGYDIQKRLIEMWFEKGGE